MGRLRDLTCKWGFHRGKMEKVTWASTFTADRLVYMCTNCGYVTYFETKPDTDPGEEWIGHGGY